MKKASGGINPEALLKFMRENGYRDLLLQDVAPVLKYYCVGEQEYSLDFQEFLGIVLPCENPILRAEVTQRNCGARDDKQIISYDQRKF